MSGKVIDFDPNQRLTKEALAMIKDNINQLQVDDLVSLTLIYTPVDGRSQVMVYGADFQSIGVAQAMLSALANHMLAEELTD